MRFLLYNRKHFTWSWISINNCAWLIHRSSCETNNEFYRNYRIYIYIFLYVKVKQSKAFYTWFLKSSQRFNHPKYKSHINCVEIRILHLLLGQEDFHWKWNSLTVQCMITHIKFCEFLICTHNHETQAGLTVFFVDNKLHAEKWFDKYMNMQINFGIKIQNSELYFCLLINVLELLKFDHWKKSQMLIAKSFFLHKMYKSEIFRLITSFSYILMISIDC